MSKSYTLYTKSNFDGLVCGSLLKKLGMVNEIRFVHPKDVQDGKIQLTKNDITAGLPYSDGVYMAFDHHSSEMTRNKNVEDNYIIEQGAPSSSRIIYEYFGGKTYFPQNITDLVNAVDISDCTTFTKKDVLNPKDWILLNFITDARTGLGRFRNFKISNYNLMLKLIDLYSKYSVEEILEDEDVKERVDFYYKEQDAFKTQIQNCTTMDGRVAIIDLRNEDIIHAGNRFMVYALFPESIFSIHTFFNKEKDKTVFAVGRSIFNHNTPLIDIGKLLYKYYNGGGHINAGTCQVDNEDAEGVLYNIKDELNQAYLNENN